MILDNFAGLFSNTTGSYVSWSDYNSTLGVLLVVFITFIGFLINALNSKFEIIGKRLKDSSNSQHRIELKLERIETILKMQKLAEGIPLEEQEAAANSATNDFENNQT